MTFDEVLIQVQELLQREKRVSYRGLKRRFDLDDEYLADLKEELIGAKRLAADEEGRFLVWTGTSPVSSSTLQVSSSQPLAPSPQPSDANPQTLDARRQTLDVSRPEAERRQLTVMFADLVGSTALSEQLDPEELREVVRAYQQTSTEVIRRYDGHIAQHLGDGLLVYFGYPAAHEDDAQRAVRTGLEILVGLRSLNARLPPTIRARLPHPLQVRIGVHTGVVVIGEIGSADKQEILALGETPNIAARVQGQAEPDEVVISGATLRLVEGLFECHDRGLHELKGISTPLPLYQVTRESPAQSRFEAAVRTGLRPLVGREDELAFLRRRWQQVLTGEGQAVLLSGEPGIGKSRLLQELKEQLSQEGAIRIEFRCSPYHQNSTLYPVIEQLQRVLGIGREDSAQSKLGKLEQTLSHYRFPQADTLPLLAALLSLPYPEGVPPLTLSPEQQKEKTLQALVRWLCEEAERQAVYCAWEDLHWADPSTLELLDLYLAQVPTARMLALLTFRPEFMPPWGSRSYLSQLTLGRLGRAQVERIVENVTGGRTLPDAVVEQVVAKTDGVPLFVEELTKAVMESIESIGSIESIESAGIHGRSSLPLGIPATLHDALMARLDRLAEAKGVAQLGAALGREFSYELLQAVSSVDEATLQHGLAQLVDAELVYQRGLPPQAHYIFKHALVQDTAYQSLLKRERQRLHQQIAQVLVDRFLDTAATQPELVAHHYTAAGLGEQAILYWQKAGERAVDRSAYVEAISHLSKGLELLKTLPETVEHLHQELNLQIPLGLAFMATRWYGAPEVRKAYTRARELCRQVGETPQLAPVLYGLWIFHLVWAELPTAYEAAEQLLRLGQNTQDPALMVEGHHGLGQISYYMGKFAAARDHLQQAIALYDSRPSSSPAIRPVQDPGVLSRGYAAWSLWYLGYPDQALQRVHGAFALAQELSHPLSFGFALNFASTLHQFRKEHQLAQEWAEAVVALSSEHGLPPHLFCYSDRKSTFMAFSSEHDFTQFVARETFMRESMLAAQGQVEEGLTLLRQSIDTYLAGGAEVLRPIFLSGLAAAHGTVGQIDEGLALLTEALVIVDKTGLRLNEVGLYLLKGQLTLQKFQVSGSKFQVPNSPESGVRSPESEAEECFLKAIEIARRQQAKSLELQAVMSLCRLWQQQGKKQEARQMLAEIYGWFTEGFDTGDLRAAKALLAELT
jgi:class 3 adenylate cyclase/tetratricopeptide (TPR) repeat protein